MLCHYAECRGAHLAGIKQVKKGLFDSTLTLQHPLTFLPDLHRPNDAITYPTMGLHGPAKRCSTTKD